MRIITEDNMKIIVADEGKHIRDVSDVFTPEHIDSETGITIPEHYPYYTTRIYLGSQVKEEDISSLYVEETIEE